MRVTQQDLAKIAGVSQATVSRVLAEDARVEEHIRQKVLSAMKETNYKPDIRARSLRQQKTYLIGLVLKRDASDLQGDPFFSMLVSEVLGYLSATPYHLCVDIATGALRQEYIYDEMLRTRRVDGLILVESEPRDERIKKLQNEGFPFVLIGNPLTSDTIHSVDNDNVEAGFKITEHLLEQGFRKIEFLAGPESVTVVGDRVEGYRLAMQKAGLPAQAFYTDFGFTAARGLAHRILRRDDRPEALVVLDDFMAMGVVDAARDLSIDVPKKLGIASFNDSNLCSLVPGGLTSVSLSIAEIVRVACGKLLRLIEGTDAGESRRIVVPTLLKARGSSVGSNEQAVR